MELFLLCASCVLLVLSSLYLLRHSITSRRHLPPGPRSLPLIGNLLDLGALPHRSLARLAKRHGPLMTIRLGAVTTVVASTPDAARDILRHHDATLSTRSIPDAACACSYGKLSMGWLPPGPRWRALRKVCTTELFAPQRLDAHKSLRREKAQQLVDYVSRLSRMGAAVDVRRVVFTTTLNLLSRTIFSVDLADLDDYKESREFMEAVTKFFRAVGVPNVSDFFPVLAQLDLQGLRRRLAGVFARLHRLFDEQIERRLKDRAAGAPPKNDFLNLLLDYRALEDGRGLDRPQLRALLTDLFSAGSDTSSTTVEWAMAELLQNPSSMKNARDELARVIGSRAEIDESDISQLKYLQAIVKETLRLHPPGPFLLPRQAETDTNIRDYTIPKGARVLVNVWAIGRDNEAWIEPEKFMPERFFEKEVNFHGRDFELLPFGGGRRICPGMPLADRMVHLILVYLLHWFEWRLPVEARENGLDMTDKFGMTVSMAMPLQAIAKPI